jgi:hypothetical protein
MKSKFQFRLHKKSLLAHILSQLNPVHTLKLLFKNIFNIILP